MMVVNRPQTSSFPVQKDGNFCDFLKIFSLILLFFTSTATQTFFKRDSCFELEAGNPLPSATCGFLRTQAHTHIVIGCVSVQVIK